MRSKIMLALCLLLLFLTACQRINKYSLHPLPGAKDPADWLFLFFSEKMQKQLTNFPALDIIDFA